MTQKTTLFTTNILQDGNSIRAFLEAVSETKITEIKRIYTGDDLVDLFGHAGLLFELPNPDIMIEDGGTQLLYYPVYAG